MRHEVQQRDNIHAVLEVIVSGAGQTALSPTVLFKRVLDGRYWNGTAFQVAATTVAMPEVDATDQPGYYRMNVTTSALDPVLGADGYEYQAVETVNSLRENATVEVIDEVGTSIIGGDGVPAPTVPLADVNLQVGSTHQVALAVSTNPPVNGKAGAFALRNASLDVDGTITDLILGGLTTPEMIEMGSSPSGGATAALTASPTFSAGGGPSGEDVQVLTVDNSAPFTVGDHARGQDKGAGVGHVHEVLAIPNGTTIHLHSTSANFDIVNGDTLEEVEPTGIYVGSFDLVVDTFFTASKPEGQLRVSMETLLAGNGPVFDLLTPLSWTMNMELDTTGRRFNTG